MPINKISKLRISDQVEEQIKEHILSGEWVPGKKIPGEMDLVEAFGVSRISIRQAIHQLVGMGVLTIKRGDGTYVSETLPSQYFNILLPYLMIDKPDILNVFEYRCILEGKSAALAAERATPEDIEALKDIYSKLEASRDDVDQYVKYDLTFHTIIASATKNAVIAKIASILADVLRSTMREAVELIGVEMGYYYHSKVLEAIINRDPRAAEELMEKHVRSSMETMMAARK